MVDLPELIGWDLFFKLYSSEKGQSKSRSSLKLGGRRSSELSFDRQRSEYGEYVAVCM